MKRNNKLLILIVASALGVSTISSCSKELQEHPYTVYTTEYFQTPTGLQNGLNALYNGVRWDFGPIGSMCLNVAGTDEWALGDQTQSGQYADMGAYNMQSNNGTLTSIWNVNFPNINLANAIIQYAPNVAMDTATKVNIIAQARFLRGLNYYMLVEQFGAIPTDLGGGDLLFNTNPFQGFNRSPINTVLGKDYTAMLNDFAYAAQNLPVQRPSNTFQLSQAVAYFFLARTYIMRGYSSQAQGSDFTNALAAAQTVINNQSTYGCSLLQDYGQVNAVGNEYNAEILFSAERLDEPGEYAINNTQYTSIGGNEGVDAANIFNPNYQSGLKIPTASSSLTALNYRVDLYGRPLRDFCPTAWLFDTAFADKINDSRFNNSFRTVWQFLAPGSGYSANFPLTSGSNTYNLNDTAFVLANTNAIADSMNAIPKTYRVIAPREYYVIGASHGGIYHNTEDIFPGLTKYQDPNKAIPNAPGGRSFPVAKLSELYLLAAEAAMKTGSNTLAAQYINVIRERAFYGSVSYKAGLSATVMDIASGDVTLDLILDERTRELCGENMRWPDLATRGQLIARVKAHNADGANNIQSFHVLRPIPISQLNAVSTPNPAQYQNPGY